MENNFAILLRLFLFHILGDFFFQTKRIAEKKAENGNNAIKYLLMHSMIQGVLSWLAIWNISAWWVGLSVFVTHTLIDYFKIKIKGKEITKFVVDQILHISILILLWRIYCGNIINLSFNFSQEKILVLIIGVLLLFKPSSILISLFTKQWRDKIVDDTSDCEQQSHSDDNHQYQKQELENAGTWIGYFERLLTFIFILSGMYEAIGFLIAAKSILRINQKNERKATEYILIGTFMSFTIAISIALIVRFML